jgi:hypothetical protein
MRKSRWRGELEAATTDKDVLNVARDYVALLSREEFLSLPADCRPGKLTTCDDVVAAALKLVRENLHFPTDTEATRVLHEVSEFFAAASAKLIEFHAPPPDRR